MMDWRHCIIISVVKNDVNWNKQENHGFNYALGLKVSARTPGWSNLPLIYTGHMYIQNNPVRKFINEDNLPNLLFYGPPGTGKTSTIKALAK